MPSVLNRRIVCYVTNGLDFSQPTRSREVIARVRAAVDAGVDWIQIREKNLSGKALLALARESSQIVRSQRKATQMIVNDRLDVALAAPSAGVHLGHESLSAEVVAEYLLKQTVRSAFSIGVSCHSLEDALRAESAGADYIFFGPVFDTPSKRIFGAPQGLESLAKACGRLKTPVMAIGGIDAANAFDCLAAGGAGVAAIRFFQESRDRAGLADFVSRVHTFGQ